MAIDVGQDEMTRDQRDVHEHVLPLLEARATGRGIDAEDDCTVLNRLFLRGPDPLFLTLAFPEAVNKVIQTLGIGNVEGFRTIRQVHLQGPGWFFTEGREGLPSPEDESGWWKNTLASSSPTTTMTQRLEALWLLLVDASTCEESGYAEEVPLAKRVGALYKSVARLNHLTQCNLHQLLGAAIRVQRWAFRKSGLYIDSDGHGHSTEDIGFYVAYKSGCKVCWVEADVTFVGTVPTTSLEVEGIKVDKQISPQFGIRFPLADQPAVRDPLPTSRVAERVPRSRPRTRP